MKGTKITTDNYFETIEEIGFENLPQPLQESHLAIIAKTNEGEDWSGGADFNRMVNLAFKKLEEFIGSGNKGLSGTEHPELKRAKEDAKNYPNLRTDQLKMIYRLELDAELEDGENEWITIRKKAIEKEMKKRGIELEGTESSKPKKKNPYGEISTEVRFINRFLDFNDKILYKKTFEIFIDELQKAIEEKKITKKSPVAKDIMAIQQAVLNAFNNMSNAKHFVLKPTTVKRLKGIIEKYENAYDDIDESYIKVKKKKMDLSGINQPTPQVNVMPSTDFTNLHFNAIGFKDKWLQFIGDPAPGFTAMVFGMPKMGKSYLCVDFAGYLARNHGRVLYVAKEEKLDATLQKKLKDKDVAHANLFVADALPNDLSNYDFIFLDSVNKLGLTPKDLDALKSANKGKSFIYIFQATKGGKFKGNNEFQHDVDVVIEVPEQGKAVQFGRFNQGGELNIFDERTGLNGLEGKEKRYSKHPEIPDISEPYFNDFSRKGWNGASKDIRKQILKDVPNSEKYLRYEWEDLRPALKQKILDFHFGWRVEDKKKEAPVKKQSSKTKDWTEPAHLNAADHWVLKKIKSYYDEGDMSSAMNTAMNADTIIREEIPGDIWKAMGGKLTPTGEAKLKKNRKLLSVTKSNALTKETELGLSLEELAMEFVEEGEPQEEVINIIENKRKFVEKEVTKMAEQAIKEEGLNITVESVTFSQLDSHKISTGAAYFTVVLKGTKTDLKKIAGEDKLFYCEW